MKKHVLSIYLPFILFSIWITLFIVLYLISLSSSLSEMWTQTFARVNQQWFGPFFNLFPFSLAEWIFGFSVVYLLGSFFKSILLLFKKQWKKTLFKWFKIINILGFTITYYFSTAGIAYQRQDLPFTLYNEDGETTMVDSIIRYFIEDFNATASRLTFDEEGLLVSPYDLNEVNAMLAEEFSTLDEDYFTSFTTEVKPMMTAWLFTEFNITGVSIAITTEAMVNQLVPWSSIPFTMAHEMAHAKGVMREEDANLVALFITLQSNHDFLRYSGYFSSFSSVLNLASYTNIPNHRQTLVNQLSPTIRINYQAYGLFWQNYQWLNELARAVNDFYLRILGTDGVSSYDDEAETETIEEDGEIIEIIVSFSPYQRLYFLLYFNEV
jgi:hypothetical protein